MSLFLLQAADDHFISRAIARYVALGGEVAGHMFTLKPCPGFPKKGAGVPVSCLELNRFDKVAEVFSNLEPELLDEQILNDFLSVEREFMTLVDRYSYFAQPVRNHSLLFKELLRYALAFFREYKEIKAVFSPTSPHGLPAMVFYHAARYLGIPTLQLNRTLLGSYVLIQSSHSDVAKIDPRRDLAGSELKSFIGEELLSLIGKESPWTIMAAQRRMDAEKGESSFGAAFLFFKQLMRNQWERPEHLRTFSPFLCKWPRFLFFSHAVESVKQMGRAHKLRRGYEEIAQTPDLSKPYVYFALHSQPERSTQPEGGVFEDQIMAARLLSATLPQGWMLYIKDHPGQTTTIPSDLRQTHARYEWDYRELAALPNVRIVPQRTLKDELVAKARACATITGSTGWESLVAGKPALVFGSAWYRGCDSCHYIKVRVDAEAAFGSIRRSTPEKVREHLLQFVAGIKPYLIKTGSLHRAIRHDPNYVKLAENLGQALFDRVSSLGFRHKRENRMGKSW